MKYIIPEAIEKVLQDSNSPLTVMQIYEDIVEK